MKVRILNLLLKFSNVLKLTVEYRNNSVLYCNFRSKTGVCVFLLNTFYHPRWRTGVIPRLNNVS